MKWTLAAQRHPALSPQPQEPRHHPLWAPNYYHIYTFMWLDLCRAWNPVYIILLSHCSGECRILKNTKVKYCFELLAVSFRNVLPVTAAAEPSGSLFSLFWSALLFYSLVPPAVWGSGFEIKTLRTQMLMWIISSCVFTSAEEIFVMRYSHHRPWLLKSQLWVALIPPLIDDHSTATETRWLQLSEDKT